jgi:hypothetical protein
MLCDYTISYSAPKLLVRRLFEMQHRKWVMMMKVVDDLIRARFSLLSTVFDAAVIEIIDFIRSASRVRAGFLSDVFT